MWERERVRRVEPCQAELIVGLDLVWAAVPRVGSAVCRRGRAMVRGLVRGRCVRIIDYGRSAAVA